MKQDASFIAERIAAQHCADLLRGTRKAVDPLKELSLLGTQLAASLQKLIGDLCAGAKVRVQPGEPADLQANVANERRGEAMLNSMIALGPKEVMMIASIPQRAVLSIVDLALGGTGTDCEVPAGKLPLSCTDDVRPVRKGRGSGSVCRHEPAEREPCKDKERRLDA